MQQQKAHNPKFVVIGGGTGSFTLLSVLKYYVRDITALVNMADDGGSTGVLRDELGVLPPGDIRQCLVALSESSEKMRELFNYRFPEGSTFSGHSFGNLFLSAVEKMTSNFGEAVDLASEVLNIEGRVEPITLEACVLMLEQADQEPVVGQFNIEKTAFDGHSRPDIKLQQPASITADALKAIEEADVVVIAPGNLYISLVPLLIVSGAGKALCSTKAKIVYVANLVNKPLQTNNFAVHDYINELERFAGGQFIDFVLYNTDEPSPELLQRYTFEKEYPVVVDLEHMNGAPYQAVPGNFLSKNAHEQANNDTLMQRSLIRHDADAVARALMRIYFS
jgi:uncharacterized cofD-like protein